MAIVRALLRQFRGSFCSQYRFHTQSNTRRCPFSSQLTRYSFVLVVGIGFWFLGWLF
jgi:hypothetical protein